MKQISSLIMITLLVFSVILAGCGSDVTGEIVRSSPKEVIKIGGIFPLTGDAAAYGEPLQNIVQLALDEIKSEMSWIINIPMLHHFRSSNKNRSTFTS